jgi:hypothetical protein
LGEAVLKAVESKFLRLDVNGIKRTYQLREMIDTMGRDNIGYWNKVNQILSFMEIKFKLIGV